VPCIHRLPFLTLSFEVNSKKATIAERAMFSAQTVFEQKSQMNVLWKISVTFIFSVLLLALTAVLSSCAKGGGKSDEADDDNRGCDEQMVRRIDRATLEDKILGSWVGQMAGVTWGASTEFRYAGRIIPEDEVPQWTPDMINKGFIQDDLYVELPFIDAMSEHGVNAGWGALGDAFRDTNFPLWHANKAARDNLRNGIFAPDSGHYANNEHCDDIDWQIEADFTGAMCPGLDNAAIDIAWRIGHVMNYGDGVLGGVFIAAMHAESFFADDIMEIVEAGRQALPQGSKYRLVVDDVISWHDQGKTWEQTWQLLQDKWGADDRCPDFSNPPSNDKNIDAKLNGAYVLIGLLYGGGDIESSMKIAMRCGQDSDCNPSSVGSIMGNWMGFSKIPDKFKAALQSDLKFLFTDYTLEQVVAANLELSRQVMIQVGASVQGTGEDEVWIIPSDSEIQPPILEQWPESENAPPVLWAHVVSQNGLTVEFEAGATDDDGILAYEWYFGDLSRANGARVEHEYSASGTYEIIVYVTDGIGNTSWKAIPVTVP